MMSLRSLILVLILSLVTQASLALHTLTCSKGSSSRESLELSSWSRNSSFELSMEPYNKNSFRVSIYKKSSRGEQEILSWEKVPCYTKGFGSWKCYNKTKVILRVSNLTEDISYQGKKPIRVSWLTDRRSTATSDQRTIEFSHYDCSYNQKSYIINYLTPGYDSHGHVIYRYHNRTNGKYSELLRGISVGHCYEGSPDKATAIFERLLKNDKSIDQHKVLDAQLNEKDSSINLSLSLERDGLVETKDFSLPLCH